MNRLQNTFKQLKNQNKTALISFITAGDPDYQTSMEILNKLPENGADIIELGIPFLDPAGDGPIIEAASKRAIENGMNLKKLLQMVTDFRKNNQHTPIILMGYYNPILHFGMEKFTAAAKDSGVDGILIVDLPPEEDTDLKILTDKNQLDLIKLITPTSDQKRIEKITSHASGFLYFVSVLGITGTKSSNVDDNKKSVAKIKKISNLPIVIGFGIKQPHQAKEMTETKADGIVVGSALVTIIAEGIKNKSDKKQICANLLNKTKDFNNALNS